MTVSRIKFNSLALFSSGNNCNAAIDIAGCLYVLNNCMEAALIA